MTHQAFPPDGMEQETLRLGTFALWTVYDHASPVKLAKAGFFYTGEGDIVQCFSCRLKIGGWVKSRRPDSVHKNLNPVCPFYRGQDDRNVPFSAPTGQEFQDIKNKLQNLVINSGDKGGKKKTDRTVNEGLQSTYWRYECNRVASFSRNWSRQCPQTPQDLARAGFFYTGSSVRCAFCQGILGKWEQCDIPMIEHQKHFPMCPFVLGLSVGNVPDVQGPHNVPKHSQYSLEITRLFSFRRWPIHKQQNPREMAAAGFFYAGSGDSVMCFFCGRGFKNWEENHSPQEEHLKYYPDCVFITNLVQMNGRQNTYIRPLVGIDSSHRQCSQVALFPQYEDVDTRLQSFLLTDNTSINRHQLAVAGFFYDATRNIVKCFCCGIELRDMNREDPFGDHERISPDCRYITHLADVFPALGLIPRQELPMDRVWMILNQATEPIPHHYPAVNERRKMDPAKLDEENRRLRDQSQCKICHNEPVGIVFLPCGHLVSCVGCASSCGHCPVCRKQIQASVKVLWEGNRSVSNM